jgi:protocatechuate 3,4-dioxygenase beta subunit
MKPIPLIVALCVVGLTAFARAEVPPAALTPHEIAGIVTDEDGKPIAGVLVDAWTWYKGNEVTTGADGKFHLKNIDGMRNRDLGCDIVEIRFSKPGLSPVYYRSQPLGVADLNPRMNDRTYIEGRVTLPDGKPAADVLVRADSGPKYVQAEGFHLTDLWTETKTDAEGKYRLYVAPDSYKIHVRVPTAGVALVAAEAPSNQAVTQDIKLEEGIRLVVKCVDGDTQAPAVGVKVNASRRKAITATSDKDGLAVLEHLPAEKLELGVSSKDYPNWWWPDSPNDKQRDRSANLHRSYSGIEVDVTSATQQVELMFEKGVAISGQVVDPDGKPVGGAIVVTALTGYGDAIDQTQRFTAKTKDDGSFAITLPSSGRFQYNLIAHDGAYGKWRKWANGVGEPMEVKAGDVVKDVKLALTAPATIKGKVVDPQGNPKPGKNVRVMASDERDSRYVAPSAKTDANGNFTITHVRPGEVRVEVEPFWMHGPDDSRQTPIEHTAVTVTAGETKEDVTVTTTRREPGESPAPAGAGNPGL